MCRPFWRNARSYPQASLLWITLHQYVEPQRLQRLYERRAPIPGLPVECHQQLSLFPWQQWNHGLPLGACSPRRPQSASGWSASFFA